MQSCGGIVGNGVEDEQEGHHVQQHSQEDDGVTPKPTGPLAKDAENGSSHDLAYTDHESHESNVLWVLQGPACEQVTQDTVMEQEQSVGDSRLCHSAQRCAVECATIRGTQTY